MSSVPIDTAAPLTGPGTVGRGSARREEDLLAALVGGTVCLLPFLAPAGPGNTALADVGVAACIVVALMWVTREQLPVKFPYALGTMLLVLGGSLAALTAAAPASVALVLAQDIVLFFWAATLALGRHNAAVVAAATHAWCRTAPVFAGVMVIAYLIGIDALTGVSAQDGVRASYTLGDPNMAGNYLVVSLFLMAACQRPRSAGVRHAGYVLVLLAILFTGSNGAMLSLLIGAVLCLVVSQLRQGGPLAGALVLLTATLFAGVVVLVVMPRVDMQAVREEAAGSIPLLRDSFGRSASSTSQRATILAEGAQLFFDGNATGVGPARVKATLEATQAAYTKEAHNDYLATLLERGVIGAVGLIALGAAIGARCFRLVVGTLQPPYRDAVPRAWLLVVLAPVMALSATFYEVLHFRHLWTWLGIVAALVLVLQDQRRAEPEDTP